MSEKQSRNKATGSYSRVRRAATLALVAIAFATLPGCVSLKTFKIVLRIDEAVRDLVTVTIGDDTLYQPGDPQDREFRIRRLAVDSEVVVTLAGSGEEDPRIISLGTGTAEYWELAVGAHGISSATLQWSVNAGRARVSIDDEKAGTTPGLRGEPLELQVAPGTRRFVWRSVNGDQTYCDEEAEIEEFDTLHYRCDVATGEVEMVDTSRFRQD